jgi:uncharacterized membrane protein
MEYFLRYIGDGEVKMQGYSESTWVGSASHRKSTSWFCFSLGSVMIYWFNKKHISMKHSSEKVEHMKTNIAHCEAIWLHELLAMLFDQ